MIYLLIIQDKVLNNDGTQKYKEGMHTSRMGYIGNTLLINGKIRPIFTPSQSIIRFRILNASNFGIHTYSFKEVSTYLIANGSSFLENPKEISHIQLSPGKRTEILVDFNKSKKNVPKIYANIYGGKFQEAIRFDISHVNKNDLVVDKILKFLPSVLSVDIDNLQNIPTHSFVLSGRRMLSYSYWFLLIFMTVYIFITVIYLNMKMQE